MRSTTHRPTAARPLPRAATASAPASSPRTDASCGSARRTGGSASAASPRRAPLSSEDLENLLVGRGVAEEQPAADHGSQLPLDVGGKPPAVVLAVVTIFPFL